VTQVYFAVAAEKHCNEAFLKLHPDFITEFFSDQDTSFFLGWLYL
jgi:hypothetical protein